MGIRLHFAALTFMGCFAHGAIASAQISEQARVGVDRTLGKSPAARSALDDSMSVAATMPAGPSSSAVVVLTPTHSSPVDFISSAIGRPLDGGTQAVIGGVLGTAVGVAITALAIKSCEAHIAPGEKGMCGLTLFQVGLPAVAVGSITGGVLGYHHALSSLSEHGDW